MRSLLFLLFSTSLLASSVPVTFSGDIEGVIDAMPDGQYPGQWLVSVWLGNVGVTTAGGPESVYEAHGFTATVPDGYIISGMTIERHIGWDGMYAAAWADSWMSAPGQSISVAATLSAWTYPCPECSIQPRDSAFAGIVDWLSISQAVPEPASCLLLFPAGLLLLWRSRGRRWRA